MSLELRSSAGMCRAPPLLAPHSQPQDTHSSRLPSAALHGSSPSLSPGSVQQHVKSWAAASPSARWTRTPSRRLTESSSQFTGQTPRRRSVWITYTSSMMTTAKSCSSQAGKVNSSLLIDLAAPVKSNLFITTEGKGNLHVKNMECDVCKLQTEEGNCLLHSVKGHHVEVRSLGGHVTGLGTIHGNVDISTCGDGAVDVKKLQGTTMNVSTEGGSLKVKAIYAESSCVSSSSGRIELGHVHGNATVKNVSGDTVIDGSNSFLKISSHSGGIDVYVGDGGSAELHSQEGAVCVRVPSSLKAGVELCGASVDISPEVVLHGVENNTTEGQTTTTGYINGESPVDKWVKAQAGQGSVRLKTQSWFESLKLGS
ncbi:Protein FAM185A [Larimichthys crocea]|uniref:Uncharacterized protein n=1 Tax=Larimichthys crocea TaxID=215358 RepID=A0ACD3QCY3_LARCR|nr:Protein FAM185A [Larimichthys crocea]